MRLFRRLYSPIRFWLKNRFHMTARSCIQNRFLSLPTRLCLLTRLLLSYSYIKSRTFKGLIIIQPTILMFKLVYIMYCRVYCVLYSLMYCTYSQSCTTMKMCYSQREPRTKLNGRLYIYEYFVIFRGFLCL